MIDIDAPLEKPEETPPKEIIVETRVEEVEETPEIVKEELPPAPIKSDSPKAAPPKPVERTQNRQAKSFVVTSGFDDNIFEKEADPNAETEFEQLFSG